MKIVSLFFIILFLGQNSLSQTFYETSWTQKEIKYTGLLIFYNNYDATMRVKYRLGENYKVAEYRCQVQPFDELETGSYIITGRNAKIVYGDIEYGYTADNEYYADNFIFVKNGDSYLPPFQIDDAGLKEASISEYLTEVEYWDEISTDKFTESYLYEFFEKDEPLYSTLLSYNQQSNSKKDQNTNLRISSFSYGDGDWAVAMSRGTGYPIQSWKTSSSFPKDWIREQWDDDYHISSIAYGEGVWAVIMSKGTGFSTQSWKTSTTYPKDWIREKWDDNYDITSIAYGGGEWAIAMSKGTGYTTQSYTTRSTFPEDWIKDKWDDDFEITTIAYGNEEWAIAMSKGTGYSTQSWRTSSVYPKDWIKEKWADNYHISSIAYGEGVWAIVMSKGTGYSKQHWKMDSTYPKEWIKEKWNEK